MVEVGMVVVVENILVGVVKVVEVRGVVGVNKQVAVEMVEAEEESTQVAVEVEVNILVEMVKGDGESILAVVAAGVVMVE